MVFFKVQQTASIGINLHIEEMSDVNHHILSFQIHIPFLRFNIFVDAILHLGKVYFPVPYSCILITSKLLILCKIQHCSTWKFSALEDDRDHGYGDSYQVWSPRQYFISVT